MTITSLDFVGINKDFQNFVALITETVSARAGTESRTVDVQELLKYTPPAEVSAAKPYTNLEEALGDVIASIRYLALFVPLCSLIASKCIHLVRF